MSDVEGTNKKVKLVATKVEVVRPGESA
jgi:hypothetical protein